MNPPDGWAQMRLGTACRIEIGGTPSRDVNEYWDPDKDTGHPWVSIKDMRKRMITETAEYISPLGVTGSNVKLQPAGTVLLSFKLTIGRVALAGVPLFTNEAIAGLHPTDALERDYLYYGLQQWDLLSGVDQAIKGATLNKEKLKRISFSHPKERREQRMIASVLATIDRAIEQTEWLIAKQQRINTGLMQDLLTRGIDEHDRLRSEGTHEFKDSPVGRIPGSWDVAMLQDCVQPGAPICYGILMPGRGHDGGVPVIKVKDIRGGRVREDGLLLTDPRIDRLYARSRLRSGDLLITIRGTTGRIAVVPTSLNGANITQDTARIRLADPYHKSFLYSALQSHAVQDQVELHTIGQAVKGINIGEVKKLMVVTPPFQEQERIAVRLQAVDDAVTRTEQESVKLRSIRTGLMQDLLTGRRRVTGLLKEQVSV